jgi:hypothetical protein
MIVKTYFSRAEFGMSAETIQLGTEQRYMNYGIGNVVLDGIYKAQINGTGSDVFHSNKTYSYIPMS